MLRRWSGAIRFGCCSPTTLRVPEQHGVSLAQFAVQETGEHVVPPAHLLGIRHARRQNRQALTEAEVRDVWDLGLLYDREMIRARWQPVVVVRSKLGRESRGPSLGLQDLHAPFEPGGDRKYNEWHPVDREFLSPSLRQGDRVQDAIETLTVSGENGGQDVGEQHRAHACSIRVSRPTIDHDEVVRGAPLRPELLHIRSAAANRKERVPIKRLKPRGVHLVAPARAKKMQCAFGFQLHWLNACRPVERISGRGGDEEVQGPVHRN